MKEQGIWVEVVGPQTPLDTREGVSEALKHFADLKVTDIYLQVYREGKAWFHSSYAEFAVPQDPSFDPLRSMLEGAKAQGMRVHAWVNVFNLHTNKEASVLKQLGEGVLLVDNSGQSVMRYGLGGQAPGKRSAYFQLDTPKLWLDPSNPLVEQYLEALVTDLVSRYPELDGVHLDFFRYPFLIPLRPHSGIPLGFDLGYTTHAIASFSEDRTLQQPFVKDSRGNLQPRDRDIAKEWDAWRRERLERYLHKFRAVIRPDQELSVAVVAWADRAYFNALQNWRKWLSDDLVDKVCLMSYTQDDEVFTQVLRQALPFRGKSSRISMGIGAYLFYRPESVFKQVKLAEDLGSDGVVLFSYRNLRKNPQLMSSIRF